MALGFGSGYRKAMMNLTASHDTPRFGTSIYNPGRVKYRVNPRENPEYKIDRPDERTRQIQMMILVQQFTYTGAPHIWAGDEVGMWGGDDPDTRKPMVWADFTYEDETTHPLGQPRRNDPVAPDMELFGVYQDLISLRKDNLRLFVDGALNYLLADDARGLLAYERVLDDERAMIAFNISDGPRAFAVEAQDGAYRAAFPRGDVVNVADGTLLAELPPRTATVWIRE
jgi:glycosidase